MKVFKVITLLFDGKSLHLLVNIFISLVKSKINLVVEGPIIYGPVNYIREILRKCTMITCKLPVKSIYRKSIHVSFNAQNFNLNSIKKKKVKQYSLLTDTED